MNREVWRLKKPAASGDAKKGRFFPLAAIAAAALRFFDGDTLKALWVGDADIEGGELETRTT